MRLFILTIILTSLVSIAAAPAKPRNVCRFGPIRIGVIDTGFGFNDLGHTAKLCKFGHKDFTVSRQFSTSYDTKDPVPTDFNGHGTNIAGLIDELAAKGLSDYCIVILKYYRDENTGNQNLANSISALKYANNLNLDYVNYSGGGPDYSYEEAEEVKKFLNNGGKLVAAAGNESTELSFLKSYYPAMYDSRITVVGNLNFYGNKMPSSNFGKYVNRWEIGEKRMAYGIMLTGTSQATAVATGKLVAAEPARGQRCDR